MRNKRFRTLACRRPARGFIRGLRASRYGPASMITPGIRPSPAALRLLQHELRNPLTGILGMTELLSDSRLPGEQHTCLLALKESGRQLQRLIEAMNSVGRTARIEPIDGLLFVEQIVRAHWPAALRQGIGLYLLFDPQLSESWQTDPVILRQLIDNLLANAIKFTHRGYVLLQVSGMEQNLAGASGVLLKVFDTGIGVLPSDRRRIYSECGQGSGGIQRNYGGSGLGLSVCRRAAAALGGSIDHRSEAGGGTCFRVMLPGIVDAKTRRSPLLRPALLGGLRSRLALEEPMNRVAAQWLQRMNIQAAAIEMDQIHHVPEDCDFILCDSKRIDASGHGFKAAAALGGGLLLSRFIPPVTVKNTARSRGIQFLALPRPLLHSNLEPLVFQVAMARALCHSGVERGT